MGIVYRAWQPSLGRQVALKVIAGAKDSKARARFRREMRALSKVNHPNLVRIYTSEFDEEPNYYTMELVEGATLSTVGETLHGRSPSAAAVDLATWSDALASACKDSKDSEKLLGTDVDDLAVIHLPSGVRQSGLTPEINPADRGYVRQVVNLVRQVALAAQALHSADVVHRDIKPGNIMVTADGSQAVLMDLGLAQLADDVEGKLTRTRQFVGTLRYASPEQVLSVTKVDARSDIYSLGATLWELLTLHPIYDADDGTPIPELMRRITSDDPERIRKHHPGIAPDLEAIVRKCMEKDPARRYATAADLAADLGRWERGEIVSAQPLSLGYLTSKFVRRYRARLAVAGIVLCVLLGSVVAAFVGIDRQRRVAQEAYYASSLVVAERELTLNHDDSTWPSGLLDQIPEPLRGWEWKYLMRLRDGGRPPLKGHDRGLWMAVFSPDGKRVATASIDGTVKIYGKPRRAGSSGASMPTRTPFPLGLEAHRSPRLGLSISRIPIMCLEYSPDGRFIASGSFAPRLPLKNSPGVVTIWDAETGKMALRFDGQLGVVLSLAYSPDGLQVASSSINPDNSFVVWEAKTGKVLKVIRGHSSQIHRIRYSPDGRLIATSDTDGKVGIWNASTFEPIRMMDAHTAPIVGMEFASNGLRYATAGDDGLVRVWETATGTKVQEMRGHGGAALGVAFSPDGKRIASGGFDKTVRLWDAETGKEKVTLRGHTDTVWSVAFSPDGQRLVSASFDQEARIWDASPVKESSGPGLFSLVGHKDRVNGVAFSPDGGLLASGSWDNSVRLWDAKTGASRLVLEGHKGSVWGVAFSTDGGRVASASWDHKVKIWDTASGRELLTFSGHTAPVHGVAFSPDGKRLVSGGFDGNVKVWDASSGEVIAHCDGFVFPILAVAFSPDGKRVASGGADRSVKVWDAGSGKALLTLKNHEAAVHGVAFSPDGKRLVSGGWDHTVRVWDISPEGPSDPSRRELRTIKDHRDRVSGVAFSPDGSRIASASEDKTVRVWEATTGKELASHLHRGAVWSVAFSPDGKRLATGCWSKSGWVKTWNVESEEAPAR